MDALTPLDVQAALDAHSIDAAVQQFDTSTSTAAAAAAAIGTELGGIVKSLVFAVNDEIIVILTAGDKKVDTRKIANMYDVGRKKVKIATAAQCVEVVGYAPGGVPPVGHRQQVPIFVDETLSRFQTVYAAAGTPNTIFAIDYDVLLAATQGVVANVVRDD